jgi:hypothetical protein
MEGLAEFSSRQQDPTIDGLLNDRQRRPVTMAGTELKADRATGPPARRLGGLARPCRLSLVASGLPPQENGLERDRRDALAVDCCEPAV